MKIKLFTLLLAITTLPFFIDAKTEKKHLTTVQKKQLNQLKNVKDQTICYLELFTMGLMELGGKPCEIGWNDFYHNKQCYPFWPLYIELWNDCINMFDPQGIQARTEVETYFDLLCTEKLATLNLLSGNIWEEDIWETNENLMQTIELILTTMRGNGSQNAEQKQRYQIILSLIENRQTEWRKVSEFKTCSIEEIAELLFGEYLRYDEIYYFYLTTRIMPSLLEKIDAEIMKFER